jgi:glycosyltransferase involved in cell wall biosynthesis
MRILILTQYYPPEVGAPQNRLSDLAERLTKFGHSVTILTALPNYPIGEVFPEYRGMRIADQCTNGIRVIRTWIYATKQKSFLKRLFNYFSFTLFSFLIGLWKLGRQDILIVESPPLFLGLSGFLLSKAKRAKLVFNVSDLWPESAAAMGILRSRTLINLSKWLEAFVYQHSSLITGQTQGIVDNVRSRFPEKRVELVTNGVRTERFIPCTLKEKEIIKKKLGISKKFIAGYAGLHGLAQGLETVIQAAQLLTEHTEIFLIFIGDGPEKNQLMRLANEAKLQNLCFYPSYPASQVPEILAAFDLAIIPLKRFDLFKGALPSKMFEAMAAGVPVLVSIEGEARTLVEKARAGICIEPENPKAMAEAILELYSKPRYRHDLGENGRRYVLCHFNRLHIAKRFEQLLIDIHRTESWANESFRLR